VSNFFRKTLSFFGLGGEDEAEADDRELARGREQHGRILPAAEKKRAYFEQIESRSRKIPEKKVSFIGKSKDLKNVSKVFVAAPREFEGIQVIADNFKRNIPVIINLQNADQNLSKRVIDFCSGLTYALEGNIKKVGDKVFLITPYNVEVNSKEKQLLKEEGLFNPYNSIQD
jgi:cell division inhibitor SepF